MSQSWLMANGVVLYYSPPTTPAVVNPAAAIAPGTAIPAAIVAPPTMYTAFGTNARTGRTFSGQRPTTLQARNCLQAIFVYVVYLGCD